MLDLPAQVPANNVRVKFLASPLNPSDINQIQGVYPIRPPIPNAIAGNEGLAEITHVGQGITKLHVGDWVIPSKASFGTWRSVADAEEGQVYKLPLSEDAKKMPNMQEFCASVSVNVSTAYRMLVDNLSEHAETSPSVPLVVIQNGANSGVGRAVIQVAKLMSDNTVAGIKFPKIDTLCIVRSRDDETQDLALKKELQDLGADQVVTDSQIEDRQYQQEWIKSLGDGRRLLALNTVGGKSALSVSRLLGHGGRMVTYGNMSKDPVTLSAGSFIFQKLDCSGYWMAAWKQEATEEQFDEMVSQLLKWAKQGKLKPQPSVIHTLKDDSDESCLKSFMQVLDLSTSPKQNMKHMIRFEK